MDDDRRRHRGGDGAEIVSQHVKVDSWHTLSATEREHISRVNVSQTSAVGGGGEGASSRGGGGRPPHAYHSYEHHVRRTHHIFVLTEDKEHVFTR